MVRTPVRVPAAVGAKVTVMVHCAPAARLGTQVSVAAKSPLAVTLAMLNAAPPGFISVTVAPALVVPTFCGAKLKLAGETDAAGSPTPVPWTGTFCGPPEALSLIVSTPLASPIAVGEKDILRAQLDPGARVAGQALVTVNASLAVTPEISERRAARVAYGNSGRRAGGSHSLPAKIQRGRIQRHHRRVQCYEHGIRTHRRGRKVKPAVAIEITCHPAAFGLAHRNVNGRQESTVTVTHQDGYRVVRFSHQQIELAIFH